MQEIKNHFYFCTSSMNFPLQRCARSTVGPTECAWVGPAAARKAGQVQHVTSVCATHSALNTAPAKMASASATRAGTESTAPSVGVPFSVSGRACAFGVCLPCQHVCAQQQTEALYWSYSNILFYFGNGIWEWEAKERPTGEEGMEGLQR